MKRILKKLLCMLLGSVLLAASLAGCGKSGDDKVQTASGSGSTGTQGHEPLTVTRFNDLIREDFLTAFHEEHPEVHLEIISYAGVNGSGYAQHSLENGDIPDIYVTTQSFSKSAQEEYLLDLSNYDFVNNYSTALLDSLDINGGIYLLPSGYQLTGIYYNKTIMEENGWEVPRSFNELLALSGEIEAAGYRTMGHAMSLDGFPFNYFFNIGNTVYFGTPDGTQWKESFPNGEARAVGNSELKETAEYFNKWVENGFITGEHMGTDLFYAGEAVFFLGLGLEKYENTTEDGKTYEFGTMPWLSEDGSSNMLTRNVSRYVGINKALAEEGNEQKLADALTFLNYISTVEGQQAMMSAQMSKDVKYMSSLNESTLPADSPYQDVADLVYEGRTVPLLYVGWEQLIVPIARDIKKLILGESSVDEMLAAFDKTNDALNDGSSDDVYAVVAETMTMEDTARLVAIAEGKAAGADCAMISLNKYHGDELANKQGLAWYFYAGNANTDTVNMIRPRAKTISVLEMTGAEIKKMRDDGFDLDENGNPYEYRLFTKGGMELDDGSVYRLAISSGELTEEQLADAQETEVSPAEAIEEYLRELGTVRADSLDWE